LLKKGCRNSEVSRMTMMTKQTWLDELNNALRVSYEHPWL